MKCEMATTLWMAPGKGRDEHGHELHGVEGLVLKNIAKGEGSNRKGRNQIERGGIK